MKKSIFILAFALITLKTIAQDPNVLFIGNSYTEVNNLPQMVQNVALSMGDNITFSSNTPGGCTFMQHCSNNSMEMIRRGGWDIVVLQEQSQYPSFPQSQVEAEVFPYAERLIDSIYAHNPCAEPMFYMTWGRENGDEYNAQYFPVLGTYEGMDSMLCERYTYMATAYDASLCPVGRVWRYLRTHHPEIELYQTDGSHPSLAGTFAAACAFYTLIFHNDPDRIGYNPGINDETARIIRMATRAVVYEHLPQWRRPMPSVEIDTIITTGNTIWLSFDQSHADSLTWNYGDGNDTVMASYGNQNIQHTYADTGHYIVTLTATRHCLTTTYSIEITINESNAGIDIKPENNISIYPNPVVDYLTIELPSIAEVTIFSTDGHAIMQKTFAAGKSAIPFKEMPHGLYTIIIVPLFHTKQTSYLIVY